MWLATPGSRIKNEEVVVHLLVYFHDSCLVAAAIAIVGSGEDSYYLFFVTPIEAVHH